MIQTRRPAYAADRLINPRSYPGFIQWGPGLSREAAELHSPDGKPLAGLFAIRNVKGEPLSNSEGHPRAFRFGLSRYFIVCGSPQYAEDSRPLPVPRLAELAREATALLYELPAPVALSVWRNWADGFSRQENRAEYLWLDALFELAWQRPPGSSLYAERFAPPGTASFGLVGKGLFPRLPFSAPIPNEHGYPMAFQSKLPDVVRASVGAIDEILQRDESNRVSRNHTMKTTILFLAANPDGVTKLALDKECRSIREKIRASDSPKALELKTEWAVRPDDLLQYLNEYRPSVLHFSGHGSANEELILHDKADQAKRVSKEALRALFSTLKDNIRLVVLNACYSLPQAKTIAMKQPLCLLRRFTGRWDSDVRSERRLSKAARPCCWKASQRRIRRNCW